MLAVSSSARVEDEQDGHIKLASVAHDNCDRTECVMTSGRLKGGRPE